MNKDLQLYHFSQINKAFLIPLFFGKKRIPFKPNFVSLEVEDTCFFRCQHCDIWKNKGAERRMNLEEMKKTILRLKKWLGTFQLNLTGGEPYCNKDTLPLIKFASRQGILVHTNSNGFLIDRKLAKKIIESGLKNLSISLDSLEPKVYNLLRGNKKAFQRATKALEMVNQLRQPNKPFLSVTTLVMKQNLNELEKLVYWTKKQGLDAIFFQALWQNFNAEYDPNWFKTSDFWPDDIKKVKKAVDRLIQLKVKGYPIGNRAEDLQRYQQYFADPTAFGENNPCFVGVNHFDIDISGEVRLCFNFPSVGNILKKKPEDIWDGEKAQTQRLKIARCERGCKVLLCNQPTTKKEALSLLVEKFRGLFRLGSVVLY